MATDHTHTRHCLKLFARLSEWIDADLDEAARCRMERHLTDCPACRVCLETLSRTVALCRSMDRSPLPQGMAGRIMEKMKPGNRRG